MYADLFAYGYFIVTFTLFPKNLYGILHDLACRQVIFLHDFTDVVAVKEFFFQSKVQDFHITGSIITGNLFSKSTVKNTIFQCNHQVMVFL